LTTPEVRPLTSYFWVSRPTITGTIVDRPMNAESQAQNRRREVCSAATVTESGCRSMFVDEKPKKYSLQPKIPQNLAAPRFGVTGRVLYEPVASRTYLAAAT
jgi:hypothetical protein